MLNHKTIPQVSGIYKITNLTNERYYIGSGVDLRRCREHGLDASRMINVFRGKSKTHKGWRIKI